MKLTGAQHLRRGADFEAIRSRSVGNVCEAFRMRLRLTDQNIRRLGVIASKRVGGSVVRSRAKRLLREAFRNMQDILPPSCDVLLIASQGIVGKSGEEVRVLFERQARHCMRNPALGKTHDPEAGE
jgi:ribonuclease P protein component